MSAAQKTLVWDLPTRFFHWSLAICFAGAWISHEIGVEGFEIHTFFGCSILTLVLWRLCWGVFGTRYARFLSFVRGPRAVFRYLGGGEEHHGVADAGHNPAGGWAILAMLALLVAQAGSGLANGGELLMEGPWYHTLSSTYRNLAHEIHELGFNLLLGLVGLHLAAVLFYRVRHGRKLVSAMLTGKQDTSPGVPEISSHGLWRALALLALCAALVWALVSAAPPPPIDGMDFF